MAGLRVVIPLQVATQTRSIMVGQLNLQTEVLAMKSWLVAVGIVVIVASFLIAHWTSWLLLVAGVGITAYGVTSKS